MGTSWVFTGNGTDIPKISCHQTPEPDVSPEEKLLQDLKKAAHVPHNGPLAPAEACWTLLLTWLPTLTAQ
ncbi:hypothetical protein CORC01_02937 [Colletotrichum orchidophilum]|uniref:Uncharacterized protein n=1 Tax=Colletotrichum orchidophilum TaxID=1209926 RepID=A0A1G4BKB9_9PEZI|nr:uncharacterized protein CORC01_02937 [Colletotrichum orchidophilum]OHF01746.1 hypothetical protein CORC01_02937 [Colletotrichum orchidophilum]